MVSDQEIERLEREHPDVGAAPSGQVIWYRPQWQFHPVKGCDYQDVAEGDCQHPEHWHDVPARIRDESGIGLAFEILRRRPDGSPGEVWSPMSHQEFLIVRDDLLRTHLLELRGRPDIEESDG